MKLDYIVQTFHCGDICRRRVEVSGLSGAEEFRGWNLLGRRNGLELMLSHLDSRLEIH